MKKEKALKKEKSKSKDESKSKEKGIKQRLQKNILLLTISLLVLLGVITSVMNYISTNSTLKQAMQEAVRIAAERIEWEITSYENVAGELGTVARLTSTECSDADKQALIDQKVQEYSLEKGKLIGADGVARIDGTSYADQEFFQLAMKGETFISEPQISEDGSISIIIAAPVWKDGLKDSEVAGVIMLNPQKEFMNDIVKGINVSKGGAAYMLDDNGNTIAHPNMDLVISKSNTAKDAESDSSLKALAKFETDMVHGNKGVGTYQYDGVKKLLAYAPVENSGGWSVAINAPVSDFMRSTYLSIALTLIIVIAGVVFAWKLSYTLAISIAGPLQSLSARLATFAQGNLSEKFPEVDTKDEVGQMVQATREMADTLSELIQDAAYRLDEMADGDYTVESRKPEKYVGEFTGLNTAIHQLNMNMNDTLHQIEEASAQVSAGADNLAEAAQSLAEGATEQAGTVEELQATFINIAEGVIKTSGHVEETKNMAEEYANAANQSHEEVQNMVNTMERISDTSRKIEGIINEIEEIASQTNLLSLNASIEAARAGEAGKGFAVVADQIGKLAEESAQSAVHTRELIMNSLHEIEIGTAAVDAAAQSIESVVDGMNQISLASDEISNQTNKESEAMKEAEAGIGQISEVVQSNSATAEETSATSEELSAQATAMNTLIQQFKLKE